ncbi:MAG: ATP-binding cassette domain-containing protein, partial [Elusimicrobiota bacterium]
MLAVAVCAALVWTAPGIGTYQALAAVLRVPITKTSGPLGIAAPTPSTSNGYGAAPVLLRSMGTGAAGAPSLIPTLVPASAWGLQAPGAGAVPVQFQIGSESAVRTIPSRVVAASEGTSVEKTKTFQKKDVSRAPRALGSLESVGRESTKLRAETSTLSPGALKAAADFTAPRRSGSSAAPVPVRAAPQLNASGARGLRRASDGSGSDFVEGDAAPAPERRGRAPTALGQFVWGAWGIVRTPLDLWFGLQLLGGAASRWAIPAAWTWTAYPLFAYAAYELLSGIAFTVFGFRLAAAAWRQFPSGKRLRRALAAPVDVESAAFDALPEQARVQVEVHERTHRAGYGELLAHLHQMVYQLPYLLRELRAAGRWTRAKLSAAKTALSDVFLGDKGLRYILKPYRRKLVFVTFLFIMDAVIAVSHAQFAGSLLDAAVGSVPAWAESILAGVALDPVLFFTALLLGSILIYIVVEGTHSLMHRRLTLWVARDYRVELDRRLLSQEMEFHTKNSPDVLSDRIMTDVSNLTGKNIEVPIDWLHYGFYVAIAAPMMFYLSVPFALFTFSAIPFLAYAYIKIGAVKERLAKEQRDLEAQLKGRTQEVLDQADKMKYSSAVEMEGDRYDAKADELREIDEKLVHLNAKAVLYDSISEIFSDYSIHIIGSFLLAASFGLSYGQIVSLAFLSAYLYYGVSGLAGNYLAYKTYKGSSSVIRKLFDREPAIQDPAEAGEPLPARGEPLDVEFDNVTFAYQGAEPVLRDLSFEVPAGKVVAIMGGKGSGKSTIGNILARLYEPQQGAVRVGGREIRELPRTLLLDRTAFVEQQPEHLRRTIRDILEWWALGKPSEAEIERALKIAGADFIKELPLGLDTPLSAGSGLSGGQGQKLAIAGAALRRPDILILDEATSDLDPEARNHVMTSLLNSPGERTPTTIIITHDRDVARYADVVLHLDEGKVVRRVEQDRIKDAPKELPLEDAPAPEPKPPGGAVGATARGQLLAGTGLGLAAGAAAYAAPLIISGAANASAAAGWALAGVSAAALLASVGFLLAGIQIAVSVAKHLAEIEDSGPRGPTPNLWSFRIEDSNSPVYQLLPSRHQNFLKRSRFNRLLSSPWLLVQGLAAGARSLWALAGRVREWMARERVSAREFVRGDDFVRPFLKRYRKQIIAVIGMMIVTALLQAGGSYALGIMLDYGITAAGGGGLASVLGLLSALTAGSAAALGLRIFLAWKTDVMTGLAEARLHKDLRAGIFRRVAGKQYRFFMENEVGELAPWIDEGSNHLVNKNLSIRLPLIENMIFALVSGGFLLYTNWVLGLLVMAVLP